MSKAKAADLYINMSAGTGELKQGMTEAGAITEREGRKLDRNTGEQLFNAKTLKKQMRGLRHSVMDIGGAMPGIYGQAFGAVSAVVASGGVVGGVIAAVGIASKIHEVYADYVREQQQRAADIVKGASDLNREMARDLIRGNVSIGEYQAVYNAAGDSKDSMKGLALAINELRNQGADASPELRQLVTIIAKRDWKPKSEDRLLGEAGKKRLDAMTPEERKQTLERFGLSAYQPYGLSHKDTVRIEKALQEEDMKIVTGAEQELKTPEVRLGLRTSRKRLEDDLEQLDRLNLTEEEKQKAFRLRALEFVQGTSLVGAMEAGSAEAYSTITEYGRQTEADAILQELGFSNKQLERIADNTEPKEPKGP